MTSKHPSTSGWLVLLVVVWSTGCAVDADHPPYGGQGGETGDRGEGGGSFAPSSGAARCADDDARECKIVIHQANGVESCWAGIQYCRAGSWSACQDQEFVETTSEIP